MQFFLLFNFAFASLREKKFEPLESEIYSGNLLGTPFDQLNQSYLLLTSNILLNLKDAKAMGFSLDYVLKCKTLLHKKLTIADLEKKLFYGLYQNKTTSFYSDAVVTHTPLDVASTSLFTRNSKVALYRLDEPIMFMDKVIVSASDYSIYNITTKTKLRNEEDCKNSNVECSNVDGQSLITDKTAAIRIVKDGDSKKMYLQCDGGGFQCIKLIDKKLFESLYVEQPTGLDVALLVFLAAYCVISGFILLLYGGGFYRPVFFVTGSLFGLGVSFIVIINVLHFLRESASEYFVRTNGSYFFFLCFPISILMGFGYTKIAPRITLISYGLMGTF